MHFWTKYFCRTEYTGSVRKLERQIEEEYIQHLRYFIWGSLFLDYVLFTLSFFRNRLEPDCFRNSCFREKSYKENLLWQARYLSNAYQAKELSTSLLLRYSGNNHLLNKAHNYPTPRWTFPTSTAGETTLHHLSLIFSVHLSSCDPQIDKILCVCSCGTLEKIYASAA